MEKPGFVAPTQVDCRVGAAPLDPPEAEIAQSKSTGMTLRSQSRENRSKVTVRTDIHSEITGFAASPEPEVARPETETAPVAGPSFGDIAAVSSRSQSVLSGSEAGVEPQSGYPFPARQEPKITPVPFTPLLPIHLSIRYAYLRHRQSTF